ncbi:CinA family protein [Rhodospirillum rubrum]|uniref:CinA-like n=1 Tax=Rhodospirillum rubrum (strain ATCC 11170 / ATH 1.1.1 / DSM 467 / LMG 4362 / NCIMB 8255 / S1) TaxID=269796 RepID=Q2RT75_RHORT|nr:nicotinamide-nucleotide amidohydrolase family protein [Rhodospirillum rubrum]ABC22670.1 CinA-like [Rhodospirillum rubrum ATCC 11170]AEO48388.1 CinA-like protein [Rhodospirillum rubrum F11]MBK5954268.1 damage-inducible protein CinA [Rhodospirillum rubrum]QXG82291.1 nicotinamide-nucleotide amidohydrolase family protein [Rhodospirillum rubrum]HAP99330.1 damage-inducible protein CinA [Rhodospirillum rubrum]
MTAPFPKDLVLHAEQVLAALRAKGFMLAAAESCTGGLITAALTTVAGSSAGVDRGFVTYSNEAKTQMLGVPEDMLAAHGAVSAEVAQAMAEGALNNSQAAIAISVTGIAGPEGGSPDKPVGLVFMACALADGPVVVRRHIFAGNRNDIRHATVNGAFDMILRTLEDEAAQSAPGSAYDPEPGKSRKIEDDEASEPASPAPEKP